MEVSSHALAQQRVAGCRFAAAVFTNLTQDHLDYHASMQDYFEAKAALFSDPLLQPGPARAVVNSDDPWGLQLAERLGDRCWRSSLIQAGAELRMSDLEMTARGVRGRLITPMGEGPFVSPLLGRFNLMNLLQAVGVLVQCQLPLMPLLKAIEGFRGVPGRMERVLLRGADALLPTVLVDYAHTPDGLENALAASRPFSRGRLICVFGCGGDRDRGKRPQMASIAARLADRVVVTSDNPRTEDPATDPGGCGGGDPRRRTARWRVIGRRRLRRRLRRQNRRIWCWWPARAMRTIRSSAPRRCTSMIARRPKRPRAGSEESRLR